MTAVAFTPNASMQPAQERSRRPRLSVVEGGAGRSYRGDEAPEPLFLEPITKPAERRPFLVVDVESKDGAQLDLPEDHPDRDPERAGFTRVWLVGAYDGSSYRMFHNHKRSARLPWRDRATASGGCIDRFLRWVLTKVYQGHNVYAHNGGNFDFLHLLRWLREHEDEFTFEVVPIQSTIQKITVWRRSELEKARAQKRDKKTRSWVFLCSMRLLPMSLDKAMKAMGIGRKEEMDLDAPEADPRWTKYLLRDCVGLFDTLVKTHDLVEKELGGQVGITAPATSMQIFRRSFLKGKIPIHRRWPDDSPESRHPDPRYGPRPETFHDWVRLAYCGGRTEIYETSGRNLRYYDLNGSYVAAMCQGLPVGDRQVVEADPKTGEAPLDWRMRQSHVGFVECTVEIPESCYLPPLPWKHPQTGKLLFPVGRFRGTWDADELALLDDPSVRGRIVHVRRVVWIGRKESHREFMERLYERRDKSRPDFDAGLSELCKLFGNGGYGKYGQKEERRSIVLGRPRATDGECPLCGGRKRPTDGATCRDCEGTCAPADPEGSSGVWYKKQLVSAPYIIPQIAAHVTSLARVALWRWQRRALDAGGRLFCSDTDSCITDAVLPSSSALGELKDEYPGVLLRGTFVQAKVYLLEREDGLPFAGAHDETRCPDVKHPPILDHPAWRDARGEGEACAGCALSKVTMKGFPYRDLVARRRVRTKENLERLVAGEEVSFHRLEKVLSLARKGFRTTPEVVKITKAFRTTYDKRTVLPDGTTKPLVLRLPEEEVADAAE